MGPIDAWIVVATEAAWLVVITLLVIKLFKNQARISELRIALAPFARMYELSKGDSESTESAKLVFKIAHDIYTAN